jgi:tartrate dehydrogenase/decarboxylase/D-malate dehydrogenase
MNNKYILNIIPGDGIGKEVVPVSLKVLEKLSEKFGFQLKFNFFDYSCDYYLKNGVMMDKDGMKKLADCDAILLGALGMPDVPDHISL